MLGGLGSGSSTAWLQRLKKDSTLGGIAKLPILAVNVYGKGITYEDFELLVISPDF
jgi:hypothetical protein